MTISFRNLDYNYFASSAKVIAQALPGAKISWKSINPTVDSGKLQGVARTIKSLSKEWIANGLASSRTAIYWAQALVNTVNFDAEEDKCYFQGASKTFEAQGLLYLSQFNVSKNPEDKDAANNYFNASASLDAFLNKASLEMDRTKQYKKNT
ncbi:MAG: hypothetical protein WCT85_00995 [Parachlamydiales bacterium]|jgi:hypothetical protein